MNYQFLTNLIALVIQLFLVSRIFKWVGVGGALLFLPLIALGGYALISFGAVLVLVRWVKAFENGTDYSLQNTTKAALFLVTKREEKYKAKAAIDTFFVRGGDTLSALAVLVGTQLLGLPDRALRPPQRRRRHRPDRHLPQDHQGLQEAEGRGRRGRGRGLIFVAGEDYRCGRYRRSGCRMKRIVLASFRGRCPAPGPALSRPVHARADRPA